jgi:tetratricopeptide (TPR) repeat protein
MKPKIDALKTKFREGQHAAAIADCEALSLQDPAHRELKRLCATMHAMVRNHGRALELLLQVRDAANEDADILFNIGLCERELQNFHGAVQYFEIFTERFPQSPEGWASLAECKFQLNAYQDAIALADRAIALDASSVSAWAVRGNCQRALGQFDQALASYERRRSRVSTRPSSSRPSSPG